MRSSKKQAEEAKPAPPKKALTAFFLYKQEVLDQTRQNNPYAKMTDLSKIIGEEWRNMDEPTRKKYDKKADEAKEKYQDEVREYEKTYGKIERKKKKKRRNHDDDDDDDEEDDNCDIYGFRKSKQSMRRR